ncbi:MAG TPA: PVC-type heme-binding CxxCH protein, partial [Candidatus Saccharimonadales bacterium]|nr:PVC-type heme-binding CxxCH protein [Candidatus Saccharimonadales bacterium]
RWEAEPELLRGLELDGRPVLTARAGQDLGVRLRDIDRDGTCEVLVANPRQNAVFRWEADRRAWTRLSYGLPPGAALVNERGEDNGVRFVDLNKDGYDDVLFSNEDAFSIHLMVPERILGFTPGWSREVIHGRRGQAPELPMFARSGPARNNGAWFTETSLYLQNEDTARLTNLVARYSFTELLNGFMPGPLSPADALATLQAPTNFAVELVAQEPLVQSPVYLNWGEDGRLWVVEMRDYPLGLDGHGKSGGAIRVLEDTDGDGRYDKSTVFAEGLNFPNGLLPWRKGILVSAAPDLLYLEDTDGDGKADRIEKLYTGFVEGNQQHRFNGFEYGLDNWLYGANGDSSGQIRNLKTTGDGGAARGAAAVNISGRDFRFRPDDGAFETVGGHTQFGRRRDDWGNWFGNANPIWLWHFWLPEQYLRRNPRLAVENLQRETATYPEAGRVRFVGRKQQRLNDVGTAGYVTSANSPTPYRDEVFGEEFARAMFISEPVYNSVRCEILEPDGVSFKSHRWHAEEAREFLTSTDPWFRPTGLKIGPDGALYVPDMYRQYIEHPEWIPDDIKARADLRAGETRGRIYRVSWRGAPLRMTPRLDRMNTADLVAAIDHPNGWQRDTIQRLLVTRGGTAAISPLRQFLRTVAHPKARLTALHALEGLNGLQVEDLLGALQDSHPAIREHAIQLSEPWLRGIAKAASQPLQTALLARLDDPEMRVRYQLAFTLGEWEDPRVTAALARLALRDAGQREVLVAVASSATRDPAGILSALLAANQDLTGVEPLLRDLVTLIIAIGRPAEADKLFAQIARPVGGTGAHSAWQIAAFAQLLQELERQGQTLKGFPSAAAALPALRASARTIARDPDQPAPRRISVLQLLGRAGDGQDEDIAVLGSLLNVQMSEAVQRAAVDRIGRIRGDAVAATLVKGWSGYAPSVRALVLDVLLRREAWAQVLLDRIDAKQLTAADLGAGARQRLLAHPSPALRQRAEKLLARPVDTPRQTLIDQYLPAVQQARGDAAQGAKVFQAQCAVCHRLNQQGNGAAPDLSSVVDRSPERMLIAILDPNRAVEDRYINYVARTRNGEDFSGILSGETANSITLISASGLRETILRRDLESLTSTRLSLMPEGFEQLLRPQDIADLLAYLDAAIGKR